VADGIWFLVNGRTPAKVLCRWMSIVALNVVAWNSTTTTSACLKANESLRSPLTIYPAADINMYSIRCARPSDLIHLPAIEREAAAQFQATSYPAMANTDLASANLDPDHDHVWVVVDEEDHPIGFAIAQVFDESVHLHEIDVHPSYARQGLGCRLIEAIADWARARGATALTLTTFSDVPWNGPYYARLGFRTLDVATLNPTLQAVRRAEESAGLPMAHRICMQLDL
jgi:GNAT superfamily N-acetyltransferase